MRRLIFLLVLAWLAAPSPSQAQFIFRVPTSPPVSGLNCADATTRCVPSEYATIDACWEAANAGDTCLVSAGTYNELPASSRNGSAGSTITFVTNGTVNVCGWDFSGNSYIRVIGFNIDQNVSGGGCSSRERVVAILGTSTKLEFWNNTIKHGNRAIGQSALADRCNQCLIIGNRGDSNNVPDLGIGSGGFLCCFFSDTIVAYNNIGPVDADAFNFQGVQNRFLNNYLHDVSQNSGHSDFWQTDAHDLGTQFTLSEGNFQFGVGNLSDEHVGVIQNLSPSQCAVSCGAVTDNVWRRNVIYNTSGSLGVAYGPVADMLNTRIYNNTEVDSVRYTDTSTQAYGMNFFNGVDYVFVRNNIAYEAWGRGISSNISVYYTEATNNDFDFNLAYDPDGSVGFSSFWTNQSNEQSNVNPNFVNKASQDFHLLAGGGDGSNARGTGGRLTTATSCSGTTVNLATRGGGWFRGDNTNVDQYGGNLIVGDTITIGSNVRQIASISGDVLTLTSSVTCSAGDSVYEGSDNSPDLGFAPYKSGGYSLSATYSCGGGTCTITPNDSSLVRWVICYSDGVPFAVDNASPYTCTTPAGTFTARVYPLYASTTLWAVATP